MANEVSDVQCRTARVAGFSLWGTRQPGKPFTGTVRLERREACIYYTWALHDEEGQFLSYVGRPVSFRAIPRGQDAMEWALQHAIEGIRRYRMNRQRVFTVEDWRWEGEAI